MNRKEKYKLENEAFLQEVAEQEDVTLIGGGVYYKVLQSGNGKQASPRSVVTVYYQGRLINGKVFDDNRRQGYPDAFRLNELITGWQIAIPRMKAGDKWEIYVPATQGYGSRGTHGIPGDSTLIFEIELVSVG